MNAIHVIYMLTSIALAIHHGFYHIEAILEKFIFYLHLVMTALNVVFSYIVDLVVMINNDVLIYPFYPLKM